MKCRLEVATWPSQSKITSPTHKIFKNRPCAVIVYIIWPSAFFFKQLYHRCLRLSLCWLGILFFSLSAFLSEASTPMDYPTNHQSFCNSWEDESACWITSRACWCLFFYSPSRAAPGSGPNPPISSSTLCHLSVQATPQQQLAQAVFWSLLKAEGERLQAQMVFLYIGLSVCLSVIGQV